LNLGSAVVALIDYGDACYTAYVCNLAICMAYCMLLNKDRYLDVAKEVFQGKQPKESHFTNERRMNISQ
jgi:Ser/Thr protein kinase RdoA (MazF antagonist)